LGDPPVCSSTVAIPLGIFYDLGFFKVGEKIGEDLDLWGRIALQKPIAFSWRGKAVYHLDATERVVEQTPILEDLPFVNTAENYFYLKPMPRYVQFYINEMRHSHINSMIRMGRKKEALRKLFRMNPFTSKPITLAKTVFSLLLPLSALQTIRALKRRFFRI